MSTRSLGLLAVIILLGLSGCSRPENPLDWEVKGRRPATLQRWLDKNLPLMPPEVAGELQQACLDLVTLMPKRDQNSENERAVRLVEEIRGNKVREVIAKGLRMRIRDMEARIDNQSRTLLALIAREPGPTPAQQESHQKMVARYRATLEQLTAQLAQFEKNSKRSARVRNPNLSAPLRTSQ